MCILGHIFRDTQALLVYSWVRANPTTPSSKKAIIQLISRCFSKGK